MLSPDPASVIGLLIHGGTGRMGRAVAEAASKSEGVHVRGILELRRRASAPRPTEPLEYPVFDAVPEGMGAGGVAVDFSHPEGTAALLRALAGSRLRLVCGTTGLGKVEQEALRAYSEETAVFYDENMSYGISVLKNVLGAAARLLRDFDVEIVESHHRHKKDRPSGTAVALAGLLAAELGRAAGREGAGGKGGVPIHSVRAGGIPGEHRVIFASEGEVLTFSHRALSREIFAGGAIRAARFLAAKPKGFYSMSDLVGRKND